jgi:WD40 repeat protein/serine/threonine protein kinase
VKSSPIEIRIAMKGRENRTLALENASITIGRSPDCQIVVDHPAVAPRQLRLDRSSETELWLEPAAPFELLESAGGLRLDGQPIAAPVTVREGQIVTVGPATLVWRSLSREEWPTIQSPPPGQAGLTGAAAKLAQELTAGRYETRTEVGRGGVGKVLEALEKPLRRPVALKVLLHSGADDDQKRLIREARITGGLQHPSIVPVHELNVDEQGRVFYTMKLVKGLTLLEILQSLSQHNSEALRRYRLSSLLTIFQKVCDAVAFAHDQPEPVIHRDLKPGNIMVGDYGEVLVMDWGAAKVLRRNGETEAEIAAPDSGIPQERSGQSPELSVTLPGSVMGTPGFMAPEQARGEAAAADERTDIYALGAILYALLTLEAPIRLTAEEAFDFQKRRQQGERVTQAYWQKAAPLLKDASMLGKLDHLPARTLPASLVAVALKAMAFHPEDRFASVKKLQADIAAYQTGFATTAEGARPWKRFKLLVARNKVLFTAIAAIFAILLTATFISLRQRKAALESNNALELTLRQASRADHEAARQRFRAGAWREGLALMGRSLTFWPDNREAANYLLSAIVFGHGDRDRLPILGVHHDAAIEAAAFSPDGRYFATASLDHTTRIWDPVTGRQVGKTLHHAAACGMPCFSPDSRKIVTTGADGVVMLWDTQTGEPLGPPMRHGRRDLDALSDVLSCVFSSDGKRILTGSLDHTARVWDAASGKEIAQLVNPHRVADARFSPDGSRILTSYWYGGAIIWDAITFRPIGSPMTHGATVKKAMFTPDGSKIITTSLDKTARVWDGYTGQPLSPPLKHDDFVWDLDISPDGSLFATASYDQTVRLWSLPNAKMVVGTLMHQGPIDTVAFSPDGKRLVSASRDHTVRLWDVPISDPIGTPLRHDEAVLGAIFDPVDGNKILSFGWDNAAYLWNAQPPSWPGDVIAIPGQVCSLDFTGDDDLLFVATRDGKAGIWSLQGKHFVSPRISSAKATARAAFQLISKQCATANTDGIIRFWNLATGKKTGETSALKDTIMSIAFAGDGHSLFAAYLSGSVLEWKIPEGTQIGQPMKHSEKMDALAVAPSGGQLAAGCRDDYLYLWKTGQSGAPRKIRQTNPVLAVDYSPDGQFIATGSDDHTGRIWSLNSGKQVGEPFYLTGRATAVRYAAGGKALLVGGADSTEVTCYDTKTHDSLYLPLPHPTGVSQITSNSDGLLVVTVTTDGVARLWRIPKTSQPPPKWLPDYLRTVGGLSFSTRQQLVEVPTRERLTLRKKLLEMPPDSSVWDSIMRSTLQRAAGGPTASSPATK